MGVASISLIALSTLALGLAGPAAPQGGGQDVPDRRIEVAELVERFTDAVRCNERQDYDAVELIKALETEFRRSGPRDRKAIVRALDRSFLARRKSADDGARTTALFATSARALGGMAPESLASLQKWIGHRRHERDVALQAELIRALGRTRDARVVEGLLHLLDEHVPRLKAAACDALGNFSSAEQKVRKEIFSELLRELITAETNARAEDSTAKAIWKAIRGPANRTLRKLSGHSETSPARWQRWWNKNKRKDWDAGSGE